MLRLKKLPDRTPVKLTITINPDLAERLADYAAAYQEAYGRSETVADLIPFILDAFISNDRGFVKARGLQVNADLGR